MSSESRVTVWISLLFSKLPSNTTWWPSINKASDLSTMTRALAPRCKLFKLAEDRGLTIVEYGAQRAALHLSNVAWILTIEKIEQAPVLMEAPSL